jgi:histidine decarboxylase
MSSEIVAELTSFFTKMEENTAHHLGYPYNLAYDYSAILPFLRFTLINLGDPYVDSYYQVDTRKFEKKVLAFFAELYKIEPGKFSGYVTAGGTEGNIYGVYLASECYPDGILYTTRDSHYSIFKAGRMMKLPLVPIATDDRGEMDYADFERQLSRRREHPAIIVLSMGTTVTGAVDSLDEILEILHRQGVRDFYIHCDGALAGMMLPFLPDAPEINFSREIDSISISGHKFLGTPVPCGVILERKEHVENIGNDIEYIGSKDTTILGARSGLAPLLMWYGLAKKGKEGLRREVTECMDNTRYLYEQVRAIGYPCSHNPYANIVCLRRPPMELVMKWQLAVQGDRAHVVVMQNVGREKIDSFVEELRLSVESSDLEARAV